MSRFRVHVMGSAGYLDVDAAEMEEAKKRLAELKKGA